MISPVLVSISHFFVEPEIVLNKSLNLLASAALIRTYPESNVKESMVLKRNGVPEETVWNNPVKMSEVPNSL